MEGLETFTEEINFVTMPKNVFVHGELFTGRFYNCSYLSFRAVILPL
jgi:hypothetical protein